jgi:hypothetical protein
MESSPAAKPPSLINRSTCRSPIGWQSGGRKKPPPGLCSRTPASEASAQVGFLFDPRRRVRPLYYSDAMSTQTTGLDTALALDAIYYSAPIPRNTAVLTIMGAVFDKVYFPGVYLPKGGYDEKELQKEIDRLKNLSPSGPNTADLIGMLEFVKHTKTLEGFCVFTGDGDSAFQDHNIPGEMARDLFFAIHGPQRPGWEPMLHTSHHKGIPGSDEHVSWLGDYHYLANSVIESGKTGIPLLNDLPNHLPIPGLDPDTPHNDAKILSTILAIECTKLALPPMPLLRPEHLMEFRAENAKALKTFRRSMLQYAGDLNVKIKDVSPADFERTTKFFIQTEIVPVMDALRASMSNPARPWYSRLTDHAKFFAELGASFFVVDQTTAIAKALANYAGVLGAELTAKGDQRANLRRSGLYYLLNLQRFHETHKT